MVLLNKVVDAFTLPFTSQSVLIAGTPNPAPLPRAGAWGAPSLVNVPLERSKDFPAYRASTVPHPANLWSPHTEQGSTLQARLLTAS